MTRGETYAAQKASGMTDTFRRCLRRWRRWRDDRRMMRAPHGLDMAEIERREAEIAAGNYVDGKEFMRRLRAKVNENMGSE